MSDYSFGNSLSRLPPAITTNFTTRAGSIENLVDGYDGANDLRPLTRDTNWGPAGTNEPGGVGLVYTGADGGGNKGLWIQWDFGQPTSVGMLRYRAENGGPLGDFYLQGSQGGSVWTTIGIFSLTLGDTLPTDDVYIPVAAPTGGSVIVHNGAPPNEGRLYYETFFWRFYRILGASEFIHNYSLDGNEFINTGPRTSGPIPGAVPFNIWCMDLSSSEYPGQVVQDPDVSNPAWGTIIVPTDVDGSPDMVDGTTGTGTIGGKPVPPSDIYSPLSYGNRSTIYNAISASDQKGNGYVMANTSTEGGDDPHEYASVKTAFNGNFGQITGDGPAFNNQPPGWFVQFNLAYAQMLTGILVYSDDTTDNGLWKIQCLVGGGDDGTDPAGAWVDLSSPQLVKCVDGIGTDPFNIGRYHCVVEVDIQALGGKFYRLTKVSGGTGGRLCTEFLFRMVHSFLEGGPRLTGSNQVTVTTNFDLYNTAGDHINPASPGDNYKALVDGFAFTDNGGNGMGIGDTVPFVRFSGNPQSAGSYFQFRFTRGVTIRRGFFDLASGQTLELYDSDGLPTRMGMWQWQASTDLGSTFFDVGVPFAWGNQQTTAVLDGTTEDTGVIAGHWRLTLVDDTTIPFNTFMSEIRFQLYDVGPVTPTLFTATYADDAGFNVFATLYYPPRPYTASYKDDDGFSAIPTIKSNAHIKANFADDEGFDVFSELSPSMVTQMVLVQTGR